MKICYFSLAFLFLLGSVLNVCAFRYFDEASPNIFQNLRTKRQADSDATSEDYGELEDLDEEFANSCAAFIFYYGGGNECGGGGFENILKLIAFPLARDCQRSGWCLNDTASIADLCSSEASKATCFKDVSIQR